MVCLSWNIRGIGARIKRASLRKLILTHQPLFVFIQETMLESISIKTLKSIWGDDGIEYLLSPSIGNSGGLISVWNTNQFTHASSHTARFWIGLCGSIKSNEFHCTLINIYNPCNVDDRAVVWDEITEFVSQNQNPCLIIGDYNEVLLKSDRGSQHVSSQGSSDFQAFIHKLGLIEINASNGRFTWFGGNQKAS